MKITHLANLACLWTVTMCLCGCGAMNTLDSGLARLDRALFGATAKDTAPSTSLRPDAYGLGVHMNEYGQAVTVWPDHGGVPGEYLELELDAYGPGVHVDQYGRPIREYTWPDGRPLR